MRAESASSLRYRALLQLLRTSDTVWNASRMFFARWDLGPSQFNVLNLLYGVEGLTQTELSRELIMHRSNVTGLVDRMEKAGWVERTSDRDDRRVKRVRLTAEGKRLADAADAELAGDAAHVRIHPGDEDRNPRHGER